MKVYIVTSKLLKYYTLKNLKLPQLLKLGGMTLAWLRYVFRGVKDIHIFWAIQEMFTVSRVTHIAKSHSLTPKNSDDFYDFIGNCTL